MIARLKGLLESAGSDWLIVDVGGVGYLVFASARTLAALPKAGEPVALHIETHVREDHIHLYGFRETRERELFRLLLTVSGVGAKVALAILSVHDADALTDALAAGDRAAVARAQGVGPKLAQRIVTELKDRVAGLALAPRGVAAGAVASAPIREGGVREDAVSALVNLGYGRTEAFAAVAAVLRAEGADAPLSALIRGGLKELGR
ncbi:MAG: Holliday junction branch migration protein RuvA [Rhodothalassiaceae bacterium]